MTARFIVLVEGIDNTQRALIHARVKDLADSWWHEFLDVWIVEGDLEVLQWRDELLVFVPEAPSKLLVLRYSDEKPRWASNGRVKAAWLKEH